MGRGTERDRNGGQRRGRGGGGEGERDGKRGDGEVSSARVSFPLKWGGGGRRWPEEINEGGGRERGGGEDLVTTRTRTRLNIEHVMS